MTSKEALNRLSKYIGELGGGETLEEEDVILTDLEVLDILKKHHLIGNMDVEEVNIVDVKGAHIEYQLRCDFMTIFISEEEYKVLKEWLKNDD